MAKISGEGRRCGRTVKRRKLGRKKGGEEKKR